MHNTARKVSSKLDAFSKKLKKVLSELNIAQLLFNGRWEVIYTTPEKWLGRWSRMVKNGSAGEIEEEIISSSLSKWDCKKNFYKHTMQIFNFKIKNTLVYCAKFFDLFYLKWPLESRRSVFFKQGQVKRPWDEKAHSECHPIERGSEEPVFLQVIRAS